MKKYLFACLAVMCALLMCACGTDKDEVTPDKWEFAIQCAEKSTEEQYVVTYVEEKAVTDSGTLTIENLNDFDIIVHLQNGDHGDIPVEVAAGETAELNDLIVKAEYMVGCHADVDEGAEIRFVIRDKEE